MISKKEGLDSPIFIVGSLRSGTTLLRLIVGNHPDIHCIGEFEGAVSQAKGNAWPELKDYHDFIRCDRQTSAHNFHIDSELGYEALVRSFLEQSYDRWPSKYISAAIHSRMDLLPKIWPNAKFVHIVRDPRDVTRSCIEMGWVGNVYDASRYWIEPETHWDILCNEIDENNRISLKYEALVENPVQELKRLCDFLSVEYSDSILNIESTSTYSRPDKKYANQWLRKLSNHQISLIESKCRQLMVLRGYEPRFDKPNKVSKLEQVFLKLQSRIYRVKFNIHRFGLWSWLPYIIFKRVKVEPFTRLSQERFNRVQTMHLK